MPTRAVRYLRVSSQSQAEDTKYGYARQRITAQLSERKHGLEVVCEITDQISGGVSERPGLTSLPDLAKQHGATAISLSQVDRLSRDIPGGYAIISELIETRLDIYASDLRARVNFRDTESVRELNDALRDAHLERGKIRTRTYGGLLAKASTGVSPRALNLYGYLSGQPLEREALWVRHAYTFGLTYGGVAICESLTADSAPAPGTKTGWTPDKVHNLLSNPTYKGEAGFGRELYCAPCHESRQGTDRDARRGYGVCLRCGGQMSINRFTISVPPLVDLDLWEAVQEARRGRGSFYGKRGRRLDTFPLTGRIACAECGRAMNGTSRDGRHYYRCTLARRGADAACSHRKGHRAERVHEMVLEQLQKLVDRPGVLDELLAQADADPHTAERQRVAATRAELEARLERIEQGYINGAVTLETSLREQRKATADLRALPQYPPAPRRRVDVSEWRERIADSLAYSPLHETADTANIRVTIGADTTIDVAVH